MFSTDKLTTRPASSSYLCLRLLHFGGEQRRHGSDGFPYCRHIVQGKCQSEALIIDECAAERLGDSFYGNNHLSFPLFFPFLRSLRFQHGFSKLRKSFQQLLIYRRIIFRLNVHLWKLTLRIFFE